jgi:NTE family protein
VIAALARAAAISLALAACAGAASEPEPEPACRFEPPAAVAPLRVPPGTRIGLALGSGARHGLAHIGVLAELEARALPVDIVTGTSAGAIVGSLWASGMAAREIAEAARRDDLDFGALAGSWQGLFSNEPARRVLEPAFAGRPIETWPKRFGAVAANVANGERRLLATGDGVAAVRASSAMPVVFLPISMRGERLVDGALVEPVPVPSARDLGANLVIAVDVAYRPGEEHASGLAAYAFQALHILVNSLANAQVREADVLIRLNAHKRWTECGREGLIAAGREAVDRAWPQVARALLERTTSGAAR